jgi:hypothetical protein
VEASILHGAAAGDKLNLNGVGDQIFFAAESRLSHKCLTLDLPYVRLAGTSLRYLLPLYAARRIGRSIFIKCSYSLQALQ